jgi:hypothetical protein
MHRDTGKELLRGESIFLRFSICCFILVVFSLFISGCSRRPRIYTLKVDCENPSYPHFFFPAKIYLQGQEKGVLNGCDDKIQITEAEMPGADSYEATKAIQVKFLVPEGWIEAPVQTHTPLILPEEVSVLLRMESANRTHLILYIDNRESKDLELSVGQWKRPLIRTPDETYSPAPEEEAAANLVVNNIVLGKLPITNASIKSRYFLVDVSGQHQYQLNSVSYGAPANIPRQILKGKHLYELKEPISYFLKPAPLRDLLGIHWELLDFNTK